MLWRKHFSLLLALSLTAATLYGLWLYNETLELERQGRPTSFTDLARRDLTTRLVAFNAWLKGIPRAIRSQTSNETNRRLELLNDIGLALELYYDTNRTYPTTLSKIASYLKNPGELTRYPIEYQVTATGYFLSITLPSGEVVTRIP